MFYNLIGCFSPFISGNIAAPAFITSLFAFVVVVYAVYRFIDFVRYRRV